MKTVAVILLALATAFGGVSPSFAENSSDPHSAQSRGSFGDSGVNNNRSSRCSIYRCGDRNYGRDRRYYGNDYRGDRRYYGNNRRYYRDGYYRRRNGDDFGAAIGGLAVGAIIGGIIASQPRVRATGSSHVNYCYSRYRSYRASDNTYQPNYGPRRQCVSR